MRLDHLRLKGITCFAEPVDIDFTQIPAGLIAVVGPNGSGKTTIVEAFPGGIFRELPTRGAAVKYATGPDSYIDVGVTFDQGGSIRGRLNLDGVKGVSDAVLERVADGVATRLNDGKVKTYDAAVATVFPPLETLLASSIAVQNRRGSFATRDKTARKDLFYALLGLNRLDGFATTARAAATLLDKRIAELRGRRDALLATTSDELHEQLQAQAYALTSDLAAAHDAKAELQAALGRLDATIATRRAEVETASAAITERARLEMQHAEGLRRRVRFDDADRELATEDADIRKGIAGRLASALRQHEADLAALVTDDALATSERDQIAAIDADLATFVTDRENRIAANRELKAEEKVIRAAVKAIEDDNAGIGDVRRRLVAARAKSWAEAISDAAGQVHEADALIAEKARLGRAANLLMDVPCGGEGTFAGCQFLRDAAESSALLAALGRRDLHGERAKVVAEVERLKSEQREHQTRIAQMEGEIVALEQTIAANRETASKLMHLTAADDRIKEREADIAAARTKADQDRARVQTSTRAARETRDAAKARITAAIDGARQTAISEETAQDTRVADLRARRQTDRTVNEAELQQTATALAATAQAAEVHAAAVRALADVEADRTTTARAFTDASTAFVRVEENVTHLQRRQGEFRTARAQRDAIDADLGQLETDLIDWQALAQMLGRDGLPVLEIDAAGPGVSAEANDLMQASYDGRFVLELVTQEPKADGKGLKEVFDLKVYDHERGGEARDVADLSGGEQVIIDAALRAAIALFINRRNEQPIRTMWLDETTGALDPDNAQRYVAMLRRLHARAGLFHLLFVSHNPDVSAQADAQLQVADGRVTVAYAPFAPAASSQEAA